MDVAELVAEGIAAFFPVYDQGNVTQVITRSGKELFVRRTCKTVMKNLARFFSIDLAASREFYGRAVNKRQGVPIPMTTNLLLIPVKARKNPLGENDGTLGYINFREIKEIRDGAEGCCRIIFQNERELEVHVSSSTMKEYMKNAKLVESIFMSRHFEGHQGVNIVSDRLYETNTGFRASSNEPQIQGQEAGCSPANEEDLLREYLLRLVLEVIHLIQRQKNQAAR